jgi:hypothetical protein
MAQGIGNLCVGGCMLRPGANGSHRGVRTGGAPANERAPVVVSPPAPLATRAHAAPSDMIRRLDAWSRWVRLGRSPWAYGFMDALRVVKLDRTSLAPAPGFYG